MSFKHSIDTLSFICTARRDELSERYKTRVANFLQDMTEGPVKPNDYYTPS